ncbi:MAG: serine/threonine-protein kinase [Isosphaeraceae bacterium]|nr:serine/threonine-protein kinase [Isosphaeraceae bacterium]
MIGQTLGSFEIVSELGSGAMGIVYKGRSLKTGEFVAIKIISKEAMARNSKTFDRFIREIDLLEKFKHPNIVRYRARGRHQGVYYYAMEYIEGATLDAILQEKGTLTWDEVAKHGIQLCSALQYAHEQSVIHRDLKPSNLMVTPQGKLKLTDFGIAKDVEGTALTMPGRTLGTLAYMSPEQVAGSADLSHKADLYALGIVFYEMLTGETPFKGETMNAIMLQHATAARPRPSAKTSVIPVALDDLVVKLMAKKPSDRPHDAALVAMKLQEMLDAALSGAPLPMVWPEEGSPALNPTRDHMAPTGSSRSSTSVRSAQRGKRGREGATDAGEAWRNRLGLAGLLVALAAVGGSIAYVVWPPSAEYLFSQADKMMASNERTDWTLAVEEYLDPLDSRFPNHPWKDQTEAWRDKVALKSASDRAELMRKANNDAEEYYLGVSEEVKAAVGRGDELDAARRWREMETKLAQRGPAERGWTLLAKRNAETLEKAIAGRASAIAEVAAKADELDAQGAAETAANLRRATIDQYAKFTDTVRALESMRSKLPTRPAASPKP